LGFASAAKSALDNAAKRFICKLIPLRRPLPFIPVLGFASAAGFRDIVRRFSRAIYETPG
jgi:hypothetical protein